MTVRNVKRSKKRQQNFKEIENEEPPPRKRRSAMETFDCSQWFFCQSMSEDRLHDNARLQKSRSKYWILRISIIIRVFKIRSLGAHDAIASELKCHQKCWNKIIVHLIPEILYASTIPSSTELESLRSHLLMSGSSAESTHFSSSHEMWALLTP